MMRALVPAKIGPAWVLLEAEIIREILGAEVWLPIPGARAEMPGVIAWRGRAIPVVDLAAPFDFGHLSPGQARPRTLIAAVADSVVAVPVDAAREVHAFSTGAENLHRTNCLCARRAGCRERASVIDRLASCRRYGRRAQSCRHRRAERHAAIV